VTITNNGTIVGAQGRDAEARPVSRGRYCMEPASPIDLKRRREGIVLQKKPLSR
jgi:hypothetical protein